MENICFLHLKCPKDDESLEECNNLECQNEINSMAVMIDWLTTGRNYSQWRGGDKQNGTTKLGIANEISQIVNDKGVTTERTGRDIHLKINCLEQQFRAAKDLLNQTGVDVTCKESIGAAVKHRCPYYYELVDVIIGRASSMPLSTITSISTLEILDGDDAKANEVDDNKPIEVDTPLIKVALLGSLGIFGRLRSNVTKIPFCGFRHLRLAKITVI